jgi:DNA invertase Pin-like site-specific DNA recombinase
VGDDGDEFTNEEVETRREARWVAYSYVRVSTPEQDLHGDIETQVLTLATYARSAQIVAHRFYADRAVRITLGAARPPEEQPALLRLQEEILKEGIRHRFIWATDVDRIIRDRKKGKAFFEWAVQHQIPIRILDEEFPLDKLGASRWFDECVVAEELGRSYRPRASAAVQQSREAGSPIGSAGKWHRYNSGRLELKPGVGDLVTNLAKMAMSGRSIQDLGEFLRESRLWKGGQPSLKQHQSQVRKMLKNPKFAGFVVHPIRMGGFNLYPSNIEPAISVADFFHLQMIFPHRVGRLQHRNDFYLLGIVNCSVCSKTLKPASAYYSLREPTIEKFVRRGYVCPENGCRPAQVYNADVLHLQVKILLETWESVSGDTGFYERWENASRSDQIDIMKRTIARTRHLRVTHSGFETPRWAQN